MSKIIKNHYVDVAIQFKDNKTAEKFIENYEKRRQSLVTNPTDNNYGSFFQNDLESDDSSDYFTSCDENGFYVLRENINFSSDLARTKALRAELKSNDYDALMCIVDTNDPHSVNWYEYGLNGIDNRGIKITSRVLIPKNKVIIHPNLE